MAETIEKLAQTAETINTAAQTEQTTAKTQEPTKPTEEQKEQFRHCVRVLEKDKNSWLATAEAIETLRNLPPALWASDKSLAGVKRPKIGQFLQVKFDISTSRISQLAGALTARRELAEVKDVDKISCNTLYEMSRFSTCKDNADGKSIAQIYEAVKAQGEVSEKAVKNYIRQFKPKATFDFNSCLKDLKRLIGIIQDHCEEATAEEGKQFIEQAGRIEGIFIKEEEEKTAETKTDAVA